VCLVTGGAIALLACLGLFEFLARRVSAGIFRSIVGEAVLAAGFVWVCGAGDDRPNGSRALRMKRVQYFHFGGPEELRLDDVSLPDAPKGQVRVQVRAAAANPLDWKLRRGEMKMISGSKFPRGLGHDFAGVVEAVGSGVQRLKVGDEVFGLTTIRQAARLPNAWSRTRKTHGSSRNPSRSNRQPP